MTYTTRFLIAAALAVLFAFAVAATLPQPAAGATKWPAREKLQRCFVYLPDMKDTRLRRWCLYWSKRLP
jgi:hypothetical protein